MVKRRARESRDFGLEAQIGQAAPAPVYLVTFSVWKLPSVGYFGADTVNSGRRKGDAHREMVGERQTVRERQRGGEPDRQEGKDREGERQTVSKGKTERGRDSQSVRERPRGGEINGQ